MGWVEHSDIGGQRPPEPSGCCAVFMPSGLADNQGIAAQTAWVTM
jgi:hypothetical protein